MFLPPVARQTYYVCVTLCRRRRLFIDWLRLEWGSVDRKREINVLRISFCLRIWLHNIWHFMSFQDSWGKYVICM